MVGTPVLCLLLLGNVLLLLGKCSLLLGNILLLLGKCLLLLGKCCSSSFPSDSKNGNSQFASYSCFNPPWDSRDSGSLCSSDNSVQHLGQSSWDFSFEELSFCLALVMNRRGQSSLAFGGFIGWVSG